jgi:hypothetical protein
MNYELDEVKYLFLINKNNKLIYKTIFFDNSIVINNREKKPSLQ